MVKFVTKVDIKTSMHSGKVCLPWSDFTHTSIIQADFPKTLQHKNSLNFFQRERKFSIRTDG